MFLLLLGFPSPSKTTTVLFIIKILGKQKRKFFWKLIKGHHITFYPINYQNMIILHISIAHLVLFGHWWFLNVGNFHWPLSIWRQATKQRINHINDRPNGPKKSSVGESVASSVWHCYAHNTYIIAATSDGLDYQKWIVIQCIYNDTFKSEL